MHCASTECLSSIKPQRVKNLKLHSGEKKSVFTVKINNNVTFIVKIIDTDWCEKINASYIQTSDRDSDFIGEGTFVLWPAHLLSFEDPSGRLHDAEHKSWIWTGGHLCPGQGGQTETLNLSPEYSYGLKIEPRLYYYKLPMLPVLVFDISQTCHELEIRFLSC